MAEVGEAAGFVEEMAEPLRPGGVEEVEVEVGAEIGGGVILALAGAEEDEVDGGEEGMLVAEEGALTEPDAGVEGEVEALVGVAAGLEAEEPTVLKVELLLVAGDLAGAEKCLKAWAVTARTG